MAEPIEKPVTAINVTLQPIDHSDQPVSANYSVIGVAQGIAYLDFGFLEPAQLAGVAQKIRGGPATPAELEGALVVRVAMGLDVVQRLQQQLQQVLVGVNRKPAIKFPSPLPSPPAGERVG
jgi:hypothetical protein